MNLLCPFCNVLLIPNKDNTDLHCMKCDRDWYEMEIDGEKSLASRPRRVRLKKVPEEGDLMEDVIELI
jgi:DNA-directed RNA polymerase subunit M/transcription elongation factor TFIIS